jgi:hypothetical protein
MTEVDLYADNLDRSARTSACLLTESYDPSVEKTTDWKKAP